MRNLLVTCGITVALLLTGSVYAAEEITWEQGKEINLGEKALDVALTDDGKLAYILTKKNISVHNLQDGRIIGTIPLDEKFAGISIAPRAKLLLLKSTDGKKISVIKAEIKTPEPVFDIPIDSSPVIGPRNAPVTLAVFLDFQCPYCSRVFPTIDELLQKYPNNLNVVIKHFPLRSHKFANQAATAALAADKQGKYLELTRVMFKNFRALNETTVKEYAAALGLNLDQLERDQKDKAYQEQIQRDRKLAQQLGVRGVPSLYINGSAVKSRSVAHMSKMIDEELKKK